MELLEELVKRSGRDREVRRLVDELRAVLGEDPA
jgi:hypothetical protein